LRGTYIAVGPCLKLRIRNMVEAEDAIGRFNKGWQIKPIEDPVLITEVAIGNELGEVSEVSGVR
jgi:hypothetical protein